MSFSAKNKPGSVPRTLLGGLPAGIFLVPILVGIFAPAGAYGQSRLNVANLPPDQRRAIGCLRSTLTAELFYSTKLYHAGYSPNLASLGPPPKGAAPSPSAANLLTSWLAGGKCGVYAFTYTAGPKDSSGIITQYSVTARPVTWKKGVHSFFADQTGVIRWTDENRTPTATDPALN